MDGAGRPPAAVSEGETTVRLTDFWSRLEQTFGPGYAPSFAADHVFTELGSRTINQALAEGEEAATVWRVVVAAYPERVPARLR
jgi:Protein of unknown function (DUF3046)